MAEWSKAPDSSSGLRERAWVQIPLLTLFVVSSNNSTTSHILMVPVITGVTTKLLAKLTFEYYKMIEKKKLSLI